MKKYRTGIVGLSRGNKLVKALSTHPQIEIAALCDLNREKLAELGDFFTVADEARYTDYDAMAASDLDIIVIATPIEQHAKQSITAGRQTCALRTGGGVHNRRMSGGHRRGRPAHRHARTKRFGTTACGYSTIDRPYRLDKHRTCRLSRG
ncbi:MAG: Gfo/Idh/MocA family oxidoreductase [Spirochaetes bacterium]|nr:Gfo/Idh/MocA family oxidoreductase [Spirochaetota bacterium]